MVQKKDSIETQVVVVGAGLTGLTTAYWLCRNDISVHVIETDHRIGGQIQTNHKNEFIFETGPTTGSVSTPEVAELMNDLAITSGGACVLETAPDSSKRRLIWKGTRFYDLPSSPIGGLMTPLFCWKDKIRILGEPWRKKGNDPDESVGALARRRLGNSFVDYAVAPFISGVYAGDPDTLVTRYALPKLYQLEQNYGGFIRGAIAKMKEPKTDRGRLATKKVFSARGGLSHIPKAEADYIGMDHISLGVSRVEVCPIDKGWQTTFLNAEGIEQTIQSRYVVTTCGAYQLPALLPFVDEPRMKAISRLKYAPVMEVNVGMRDTYGGDYIAFGGLVPTVERKRILGVLFPSACFTRRAPKGGVLFSFFMGGMRNPEMLDYDDETIELLVIDCLHQMLMFPKEAKPDFIHISRHQKAIPQYEADSGARFEAVASIERQFQGLVLGGNLRGGIGMAHRITQATQIANEIVIKLKNK
ncbi:MAG: protoporphyrinogen oxidase [Prevotella sp.]|nr:protoporphyrinogen oxidase [Prevotella sp.]